MSKSSLLKPLRQGMAKQMIGPLHWIITPSFLAILATMIMAAPIKITGFVLPEPVFPLVLAFSWPLIRPSYFAPFALLFMGFFLEYFWGAPMGFYSFLLISVYGLFLSLRGFIIGQEQIVINAIFVLTSLGFFTIGTILITIQSGMIPRLFGVFEQILATALCFPLVNRMLNTFLHADVRFQ